MREIKLLRASCHENVVSVIEAFRSQSSGNVYLVMEYADSCLNQELKKNRNGLTPEGVERISWQMAAALHYLHAKKVGGGAARHMQAVHVPQLGLGSA